MLRKILPFVAPHRRAVLVILALAVTSSSIAALEPLAVKFVFDGLADGGGSSVVVGGLLGVLGAVVAREALAAVLDSRIWRTRIGIHFRITRATVTRLHSLPLAFHERESVGAVMTKMNRGINGFCAAFGDVLFHVVPSIVYLAVAAGLMVSLDWRLSIVALAFAPLPPLIGAHAAVEQAAREQGLLSRWARVFGRFNEVLSGIAVVKSFAMEEIEKRRFFAGVREANAVVLRGVATDARTNAAKNLTVGLARFSALALGGWLHARGEVTIGTLMAFLGYVGALFGPLQGLTGAYQTLRKAGASAETIFAILEAQDSLGDAPDAVELPRVRGDVELAGVSFGYRPDRLVLDGVDLRVRAGETVALVGPSGGGKTTLVTLLQRLYDPTSGAVLVDGVDVRRLKQRWLRRQIGVVLQDGGLFSGSIAENIAFGMPGASREAIEAAARAANAHDFVSALPEGYETEIGERGATLSGGQAQRLEIARALLKDPPILVLDEATSALDAETECLVQEAVGRLKVGRTTIVIAHRLATVVSADRIVLLKQGRIAEMGTHEGLARGGEYARLVSKQALAVPAAA